MLGRLFSDDVIELEVEGTDFLLRLASRGDYLNWRRSRAENHAFLQPYEPVWAEDALDEDRYRMMVRDARRAFRYQSGAVMFLIHKDEGEVIGGINPVQCPSPRRADGHARILDERTLGRSGAYDPRRGTYGSVCLL